ncbi:MAG TPA: hypothetical protein VGG11_12755 [Xanthobacteraceae bacterium]|jgi:hypothetical protein
MASILPFLPRGVFDDAATTLMGQAFDAACQALHDTGQPPVVQEVMARRIIAAARRGERDLGRLRAAALAGLTNGSARAAN